MCTCNVQIADYCITVNCVTCIAIARATCHSDAQTSAYVIAHKYLIVLKYICEVFKLTCCDDDCGSIATENTASGIVTPSSTIAL
jgi:hypothetical protein